MQLKGGVLMIGSLLWDPDQQDKIGFRDRWRRERLIVKEKIHVKAPIRYGRRSSGTGNLTMVFSKECETNHKLGTAYLVPFRNGAIKSFKGIENQARFLSEAEGTKDDRLKKGIQEEWCTIGILFNPKLDGTLKAELLAKWTSTVAADGGLKNVSIYRSVLSEEGEMTIPWLKAINQTEQPKVDEFDFLLSACTKPTENPFPNEKMIAEDIVIDERRYFFRNIQHGITTFQDRKILSE